MSESKNPAFDLETPKPKQPLKGEVIRYELPNLCALNFVLHQALAGGVTRSLALDRHGKSLSSVLMEMEI